MDTPRSSTDTITSRNMTPGTTPKVSPTFTAYSMDIGSSSSLATSLGEPAIADKATPTVPAPLARAASKGVQCWAHRGNAAGFPENTRASFSAALKAGTEGIETDLHVTSDGRVVCFHDPDLSRTTNSKGFIQNLPWVGALEHVRTTGTPIQPIPLFEEVLELLMMPENMHVSLNIDLKVDNNPALLFPLIAHLLSLLPNSSTLLAPRIILGIWHPKFLPHARAHLPSIPVYCISMDIPRAREYFFDGVQGMSLWFDAAITPEGKALRAECVEKGKRITVWTVNTEKEMLEVMRWPGVQAIITDKPAEYLQLKKRVEEDPRLLEQTALEAAWMPFSSLKYYSYWRERASREETEYLERVGGPFKKIEKAVEV